MSERCIYKDNLCLIKTNKYKSINVYFNFAREYSLKTKLTLNILCKFLGEHSLSFKTKEAMVKHKDMLYGANANADLKAKANLLVLSVKYSFINPRFLNDVSISDYINFIEDTLKNVYFSEELFKEYKKAYKDAIARHLDNPMNLANNNVFKIIGEMDEQFKIYDVDHITEIDDICLNDVKEAYDDLFKKFSCDVFVVGDYDERLVDYLENYHNNISFKITNRTLDVKEIDKIVERKDVSQSCLNIVYKTKSTRTSKDYYANTLGNILFGVVPTSLLFEEIREKLSLCYQIVSIDYKNEGITRICTLYDKKNTDTIEKEIDAQLKRIIDKDYELDKLESARALVIDSLRSTFDDNDSSVDYLYINKLNDVNVSIEEYEEEIKKINVDDISRVFKDYSHVLTYVLEGVKNEEDL